MPESRALENKAPSDTHGAAVDVCESRWCTSFPLESMPRALLASLCFMLPRSWISLPPSFAFEMPPRGPLELWLQHADCSTLATRAEVAVVAPGKVYMTRGWGEIARVCRSEGALVIHLDYDGAYLMLFKVFDEEGRMLECCPKGSSRSSGAARTRPAIRSSSSSSDDGGRLEGSSDSSEFLLTPATSDDSCEPPSSHRARSRAGSSGRRRH